MVSIQFQISRMSASQETCPFCQKEFGNEETSVIGQKGADGINNASWKRGDNLTVAPKTRVHKSCRANYINPNYIDLHKKTNQLDCTPSVVKRSARASVGPYDSKTDCLYCGNKVVKFQFGVKNGDCGCVKTDCFADTILSICKIRADEWAFTVQGRIEYYGGDLHAADCLYHRSCDIHFRTFRDIPMQHRSGPSENKLSRKLGRPRDTDQEEAFLRMCAFFEDNDEEQLSITDLANKMEEYLHESESSAYGNQYLKCKLMKHYGDSIFVAEGDGLQDIVTFRERTGQILRNYFHLPKEDDEEEQKRAIIETAARLIKSDIKCMVTPVSDEYPNTCELKLERALEYLPESLRLMLQLLFVGKDVSRKCASIGQSIVQAVRPRAVIAPLQLGLCVQMHHLFRSRFLIDSLSVMGYCSSYSEVQRFENNAAAAIAPDMLGGDLDILDMALLFAADNVDHNIVTLDGKGTFHGMGMIAAITPGKQVSHTIPRRKRVDLNILNEAKVDIKDYRFAKHVRRNVKFMPLPLLCDIDHKIDILWEISLRFRPCAPNWQGMMHTLFKGCDHPGQSSIVFLPMIDMSSSDKTCIFSTLEYVCNLAAKQNVPPIITFDQPLFWKASEIVNEAPDNSPIRDVVLLLGSFHTFMNLLGAIGTLMDGSGLREILETIYGENAVVHMMSGKSVQRAFRGHLLVDQCLTHQIVAEIIKDEPCFENVLKELETFFALMETGERDMDSLRKSDCIGTIADRLKSKAGELSSHSRTNKLWLNYQQMLGVARELIEADRTGSWKMHLHAISDCLPIFAAAGHRNYLKSGYLYLQKMYSLETENHSVYQKFMNGFHVIRRSNQYWAGLSSDLVIEQTLMRSLKSTGGLTRGSGFDEHQRTLWTMSRPVTSAYNYAMQEFSQMLYTTSEQHKEATSARMNRDKSDKEKLVEKLADFSPFTGDATLRNIITGINANDNVNVDDLFTVGNSTVQTMEGQSIFSYSHKRNTRVKTLATARAIKVTEDRAIDPALLFQRYRSPAILI